MLKGIASSPDTTTGMNWTELREGDSYIKRAVTSAATKAESSRLLQTLGQQAKDHLKELIHSYNMYGSIPTQVAGKDTTL